MAHFTLDELRSVIVESAGDLDLGEGALDGDIRDASLFDLGLDSLALMDVTTTIRRRFGVRVDMEKLSEQSTVREVIDQVDHLLSVRSVAAVIA